MLARHIIAVLEFLSLVVISSQQWRPYDGGLWPQGDYALLKPRSGCPTKKFGRRERGIILFRTEPSINRKEVSEPNHLSKPVWFTTRNQNFVVQQFCVSSHYTGDYVPVDWPSGSYCILGKNLNACPKGFSSGTVTWSTGNTTSMTVVKGTPPAGRYLWNSIQLGFCCRSDGSASKSITLPVGSPFYLYRKGGICQMVRAANVREEFVMFDTIPITPSMPPTGEAPDVSDNPDVKLHLCYYSRDYTWIRPTNTGTKKQDPN